MTIIEIAAELRKLTETYKGYASETRHKKHILTQCADELDKHAKTIADIAREMEDIAYVIKSESESEQSR